PFGGRHVVIPPGPYPDQRYAAAIDGALGVVAGNRADRGSGGCRDHRRMTGVPAVRHRPLLLARGGAADGSDLAVRPWLLGDPLYRIVAVRAGAFEIMIIAAFGKISPALALMDQ